MSSPCVTVEQCHLHIIALQQMIKTYQNEKSEGEISEAWKHEAHRATLQLKVEYS
jgi:hypothetical protein